MESSATVPTPKDLAGQANARRQRPTTGTLESHLRAEFAELARVFDQCGLDLAVELDEWVGGSDSGSVQDWIYGDSGGFVMSSRVWESMQGNPTPLLGRLVQEERLCRSVSLIAPYLKGHGISLADALLGVRREIAQASLDLSFQTSRRRRTVFSRLLALALQYSHYLLDSDVADGQVPASSMLMRLGVAQVMAVRFARPRETDLRNACKYLLDAHGRGSDGALTFYVEGCIALYDYFGDAADLRAAAQEVGMGNLHVIKSPTWYLTCAELWMKMSDTVPGRERSKFLQRALNDNDSANGVDQKRDETLRREMQKAYIECLIDGVGDSDVDWVAGGLSFPYCLRDSSLTPPDCFYDAVLKIALKLDHSPRSSAFLYRDIRAELFSYHARHERTHAGDARRSLRRAVALREATQQRPALRGEWVELTQEMDRLTLAQLESSAHQRRQALQNLVSAVGTGVLSSTRLMVISHDVESHGPLLGAVLRGDSGIALEIRNGAFKELYARAAIQVERTPDITLIPLGGRGKTYALRDTDRIDGHTFAYKEMTESAYSRDLSRSEELRRTITARSLTKQYGVVEHLTVFRVDTASTPADPLVRSMRRFSRGRTLKEYLLDVPGRERLSAMIDTAGFLALIHSTEQDGREVSGVRKTIRDCEVGRWLKVIVPDQTERKSVFDSWYSLIEGAPPVPRRDAHASNWLVETGGRVLAVDLDATGWRPLGYELAQLTEDGMAFGEGDWGSRMAVVSEYWRGLKDFGSQPLISLAELESYYTAGVIARCVRSLTSPDIEGPEIKRYAGAVLRSIAQSHAGTDMGDVAALLTAKWAEQTGSKTGGRQTELSGAKARRVSRAMAHHLRHNPEIPAGRDGFVHAEELAVALREQGHRVLPEELKLIAGALGEPRFELQGEDIRARYGHSVGRLIEYEKRVTPHDLFHATPLSNLSSIFEAQAGLQRGKRAYVHLTDDVDLALNASRRHGEAVAALRISPPDADDVVFASGKTWLCRSVPFTAMQMLPLYRERSTDLQ